MYRHSEGEEGRQSISGLVPLHLICLRVSSGQPRFFEVVAISSGAFDASESSSTNFFSVTGLIFISN